MAMNSNYYDRFESIRLAISYIDAESFPHITGQAVGAVLRYYFSADDGFAVNFIRTSESPQLQIEVLEYFPDGTDRKRLAVEVIREGSNGQSHDDVADLQLHDACDEMDIGDDMSQIYGMVASGRHIKFYVYERYGPSIDTTQQIRNSKLTRSLVDSETNELIIPDRSLDMVKNTDQIDKILKYIYFHPFSPSQGQFKG